jgi:spore germination cell wall hydrolase CwlJ-like protein
MYNSQNLDTSLVSKTWKVLLAVLSVTFIWNTILTGSYAKVLPKPSPEIRFVKPPITNPPVLTKEHQLKMDYEKAKFLALVDTGEKVDYDKSDLFCLAKNIYHEAGAEPLKGRYAVAQVTLNRTTDPKFEGSICDVVLARNQFTWANNRHMRWSTPSGPNWEEAKQVAIDTLNGKRIKGMEDALYYHADYVHPRWRHVERLAQIGAHIFYVRQDTA